MVEIDEIDRAIIRELVKNSRATYTSIARAVGLSDVAVIKRVKKLEQSGVIKRYTAIVNPSALGYTKISFTGINVRPEHLFDVVRQLKNKDYVKYLALTSGDHNILAIIWAKSAEELDSIHSEIKSMEGVTAVYPMMLLEVVKDELYV